MSRVSIPTDVGLADAELTDYCRRDDELVVGIKAWNEERLLVRFREPVAMHDRGAWSVSDLCESGSQTALLQEALGYQYETIPSDHGLRVFEFLDVDGQSVLEVIAREVAVERAGREHSAG